MKKIIEFQEVKSGQKLLSSVYQMISDKRLSPKVSYIRIRPEHFHFFDLCGPDLVRSLKIALANEKSSIGLYLDLRLLGSKEEIKNILKRYFAPDLISVSSTCSIETIIQLRKMLPKTKLAMVSVFSDINPTECYMRFNHLPQEKAYLEYFAIRKLYQERIRREKMDINPEPFDFMVSSKEDVSYLIKGINTCKFIINSSREKEQEGVYETIFF